MFLTQPVTYSTAAGAPWPPRHPPPGLCAGLAPGPTALPCHSQGWAHKAQPLGGRATATSGGRGQLGETVSPSELPQCFLPRHASFHSEQKPLRSLGGRKIKAVSSPVSTLGLWEGAPQCTPSHVWGATMNPITQLQQDQVLGKPGGKSGLPQRPLALRARGRGRGQARGPTVAWAASAYSPSAPLPRNRKGKGSRVPHPTP